MRFEYIVPLAKYIIRDTQTYTCGNDVVYADVVTLSFT